MSVKNIKKYIDKTMNNLFFSFDDTVKAMNTSKLFAGLMILILNIASKFVTIKLGKTMESYLKFTFSKQILVFAMAWMGTRDIYVALIISISFIILTDYLFHEDSPFCCLPSGFKDYHLKLLEENEVTDDEIKKAKELLEKAERQKSSEGAGEKDILNVDKPLSLDNRGGTTQKLAQILY